MPLRFSMGYFRYVLDTTGVKDLKDFDKQVWAVRVEFIPERTRLGSGSYTRALVDNDFSRNVLFLFCLRRISRILSNFATNNTIMEVIMFGIEHFITFVIAAFFFIIAPGIDTIFVLNKSVAQGKKNGIYAALGVNSGILVHTLFAALGLSLIIARSAVAFSIVKYAGAAYLFYLGISKLAARKHELPIGATETQRESCRKSYISGTLTNVLNPKVALFFIAFFPQFIKPEAMDSPLPFIILGITYAAIGLAWFILLTLCTSVFSDRLMNNPCFGKWIDKVSGMAYILLGVKIALTKR